jgi:hypothetical protein
MRTALVALVVSIATAASASIDASIPPDWSRAAVVDCLDGRVVYYVRTESGRFRGPRSIAVGRVGELTAPSAPALAESERLRGEGRRDEAAAGYAFVIAEHAARRTPSWAAVLARARLLGLAAEIGDADGAAEQFEGLTKLRPGAAAGFLPASLDGWEPDNFNAAVRRLQAALLTTLAAGREADGLAVALERLEFRTPRPVYGPGFLGLVPRSNRTTVFALDLNSLSEAGRTVVRRELAAAIYRLRCDAGIRFVIAAGLDPATRFPALGESAASLADKHAAAAFLAHLDSAGAAFSLVARRAGLIFGPTTVVLVSAADCSASLAELRRAGVEAVAIDVSALPALRPGDYRDEFPEPPASGERRVGSGE